jgi:hypothetical protein
MVADDTVFQGVFRHVASLCFKCFQLFQMYVSNVSYDVAKVDRDVGYVAMVAHVCCKHLFQYFICFSDYIATCKCVFLDVAYVFTHMF